MRDPLMAKPQEMIHDEVDSGDVVVGDRVGLPGTIMTTEQDHEDVPGWSLRPG